VGILNNVFRTFVSQTQIINEVYIYIQDPLKHFNEKFHIMDALRGVRKSWLSLTEKLQSLLNIENHGLNPRLHVMIQLPIINLH